MNILIGGKLGDFIHSLILPQYIFQMTGKKSNIYICNHDQEVFASGLEKSYSELLPIVSSQMYVNHFGIYNDEIINIDLTSFRKKENLFTTSWNEFYLWNYLDSNIQIPFNHSWIDVKKDSQYDGVLLVNRNMLPYTNSVAEEFYRNYIRAYKGRAFFICSWEEQYQNFSLKDELPMLLLPELSDVFTAIASCEHFIGNLTATSAMATAVNKPRTVEIFTDPIRSKYIHEMKYYNNLICFE